jgi:peptidoglycan/LPS O-acetylase OafA/YrhL
MLAGVWLWTLATDDWGGAVAVLRKDCAAVLLYYYNWRLALARQSLHSPPLAHLWSLSVEEQFYLVWPAALVLLLALGARRRWLLALVLAGVAGPALLRWGHLLAGHDPRQLLWYWRLYGCSDVRADSLSAGCLVGLLATWGMLPARRWGRRLLAAAAWLAVAALGAHLVLSTPLGSQYMFRWGFTLVALSAAVLLGALMAAPPWPLARLLETGPLRWVGRISYGTYLWHVPVLLVFLRRPENLRWPRVLVIWLASLAAGALSHYCLERPFLRLKQRLDRHSDPTGTPRQPTQPLHAAA